MRCDVGLQAPLGWKVVQSLSARRIARIWNMHSIFQFPRSRSRVAKDYKIVWAGLCKAGLRWPGVRAKFEINHEGLKRKFQFNSFYIGRKIIAVLHQSIPAAPSAPPPPPTSGYCGAFAPLFNPGVGYLQILRCPGAGICQPRGYSRAFDTHAVRHQNITTKRILLEKQQIRSSVKDSWL